MAPLRRKLGKARTERLTQALSLVFGTEAFVVLKDIWRLDRGECGGSGAVDLSRADALRRGGSGAAGAPPKLQRQRTALRSSDAPRADLSACA